MGRSGSGLFQETIQPFPKELNKRTKSNIRNSQLFAGITTERPRHVRSVTALPVRSVAQRRLHLDSGTWTDSNGEFQEILKETYLK